jgi:hypothetical protein
VRHHPLLLYQKFDSYSIWEISDDSVYGMFYFCMSSNSLMVQGKTCNPFLAFAVFSLSINENAGEWICLNEFMKSQSQV